jgi:hypothetical protein
MTLSHLRPNDQATALARWFCKAGAAGTRIFDALARALLEQRMNRMAIEGDLYRKYYIHSSKNDDDLPVVVGALPRTEPAPFPRDGSAGWLPAALKRLYPVATVVAIFAALLLVTSALRLAIWLTLYHH